MVGRVSQEVICYRLDSMGKESMDEKMFVYDSGSFVKGVVQTKDYCTWQSKKKIKLFTLINFVQGYAFCQYRCHWITTAT